MSEIKILSRADFLKTFNIKQVNENWSSINACAQSLIQDVSTNWTKKDLSKFLEKTYETVEELDLLISNLIKEIPAESKEDFKKYAESLHSSIVNTLSINLK